MKIEVQNYCKTIKKKEILKNVNLTLESGKVYGFYGRNGSGKTMLFRAITTLIYPTSGDVLVDGKSILKEDYDLRNFGVMIDDPGFYPYLSGLENLDLFYTINHKKDLNYVSEWMEKIGLTKEKNKKYKEYSLGMKQKMRILQAIMENQKIIILDEPTNGLDEKSVEIVRNLISDLCKEGKLILIASHNKEDLKILCDKVYKMEEGSLIGEIKL